MHDDLAVHYLADALVEALFRQPGPTRWRVLGEQLPADLKVGYEAAQAAVEADGRLAVVGSRWDLAHRQHDAIRPLGGALQAILQASGRPLPRVQLISELVLRREGDPVEFTQLLERLIQSGREVAEYDGQVYLPGWLLQTQARDDAGRLFLNDLQDQADFLALRPKILKAAHKGRTLTDTAEAVLKAAKRPVPGKGLALLVWEFHGEKFNPLDFLQQMCADDRFVTLSGPCWILASQEKTLLRTLAKEAAPLEPEAEIDLAAILSAPAVARFNLAEETDELVRRLVHEARTPVTVGELVSDLLALRPRQKNFGPAIHALEARLSGDLSLLRLAPGCYLSRQSFPPWVRSVPATLAPEKVALSPSEASLDVILPLEKLPPELAEVVRKPHYEDQGEPEVALGPEAVDETTLPVLYHHTLCGTLKLRLCDRRLFDVPGPLSVIEMETPEGWRWPVWVNTETRLLYGLLPWFSQNLPPCGALLTIRRSAVAGRYELHYDGETDPGVYVGRERFGQLLGLRERLRRRRAFLTEIATELLASAERGLAFDQLWSQTNLIRRTTRLQLASVLHYHARFAQTEAQRWRLA